MKRTGGEKTDELLGNRGGGPEGLPDSIIVTSEGIEGEAPDLPSDVRNDTAPPEEALIDVEPSPAPARKKDKAGSKKSAKAKTPEKKNPAKVEPRSAKQMTLGFEKTKTGAKRWKR